MNERRMLLVLVRGTAVFALALFLFAPLPALAVSCNAGVQTNDCTVNIVYTDPGGTDGSGLSSCQYQVARQPDEQGQQSSQPTTWIDAGDQNLCTGEEVAYLVTIQIPENSVILTGGSGTYDVWTRTGDEAGNVSTQNIGNAFEVNVTAPPPSAPDLEAGSDTGTSATDNVTSDLTPSFSGTAETGSTVTLYRDGAAQSPTTTAGGLGSWSLTLSDQAPGTHTFTATATNDAGESGPSAGLGVTLTNPQILKFDSNPAPPVTVSQAEPTITIDWSVKDSGGAALQSIELWRKIPGGSWEVRQTTNIGAPSALGSFQDSPTGEGSFQYGVHVVDASGDWCSESACDGTPGVLVVTVDTVSPTAPGQPAAENNPTADTTPTWSWDASADSGTGVDFYTVFWGTVEGSEADSAEVDAPSTTFTHTVPLEERAWFMKVRATDGAGNESLFSPSGSVDVDTTTLPSVETTSASSVGETTAVINGKLLDDGGDAAQVWFEWGKTSAYGNATTKISVQEGQSFSSFRSDLTKGEKYHYRALAENSKGSVAGSDETFFTLPAPSIFTSVTAASFSEVDLEWNFGVGADRVGIWRKQTPWTSFDEISEAVKVYEGADLGMRDGGLQESTTYYYMIASIAEDENDAETNGDGFESQEVTTPPSNTKPVVSLVVDEPDPVAAGSSIGFNVEWSDADGDATTLHVCKQDGISGGFSCQGGNWCEGEADSSSPSWCDSAPKQNDEGQQNYYVFVCDGVECSSSFAGTFEVDATAPAVEVTGAPASWTNQTAEAGVTCTDGETGCDTESFRFLSVPHDPSAPDCSATAYEEYTSSSAVSSHSWVCAAAKDNAGNVGHSSPAEFQVDQAAPESIVYTTSGLGEIDPGSWQTEGTFTRHVKDVSQTTGGSPLDFCEYEIWRGAPTLPVIETRDCSLEQGFNSVDVDISVGPAGQCFSQGVDACTFIVYSYDVAQNRSVAEDQALFGNTGLVAYDTDWEAPTVGRVYITASQEDQVYPIKVEENSTHTLKADVFDEGTIANCELVVDDVPQPGFMELSELPCVNCAVLKDYTFDALPNDVRVDCWDTYATATGDFSFSHLTEGPTDRVEGLNSAPSVVNLVDNNGAANYCGSPPSPPVKVSWEFSDPDQGDTQSAYQVQFSVGDADFTEPEIDSCLPAPGTCAVPNPSQEYTSTDLEYNSTTYFWRVKVWDSAGEESAWSVAPESFTTPLHHYPFPDFTPDPTTPSAGQQVQFTNETSFGGTPGTFLWDFGDETQSTLENPTHAYENNGTYEVGLTATDSVGECTATQTLRVRVALPDWLEISPF